MMAAKKEPTELVVDVAVPAEPGINIDNILKAALLHARNEVPNVSGLVKEIVGSNKKGSERIYKVRISWPEAAAPAEGEDTDFIGQHLDALSVPTKMPAESADK